MHLRALLLFSLCLLLAAPASAQTVKTIEPQAFAELLTGLGFPDPEIDSDGDVFVRMQGYRILFLIGTYDNRAVSARFAIAGTRANLSVVNQWNSTRRFSRAYLDGDGDPVLAADLDLDGGVDKENIREFVRTFNLLLGQFLSHVTN